MHSLRSNRAPFRFHVSLASALFLAACGELPSGDAELDEKPAYKDMGASDVSMGPSGVSNEDMGPSDVSSTTSALLSNCPTNLTNVTVSGSCYCPPMTSFSTSVWGTGVYSSDSHLCTAAVHSHVISPSVGGDVSYTMLPGRKIYCGSTENLYGVKSKTYTSTYNYTSSYSLGGTEIVPIKDREKVTHHYTARLIDTGEIRSYTRVTSCIVKPVSIQYVTANDGDLLAIGGDGTQVVIDGAWLPIFDSYTPTGTTRSDTDCVGVCPAN